MGSMCADAIHLLGFLHALSLNHQTRWGHHDHFIYLPSRTATHSSNCTAWLMRLLALAIEKSVATADSHCRLSIQNHNTGGKPETHTHKNLTLVSLGYPR
jgi:hypothetical protein